MTEWIKCCEQLPCILSWVWVYDGTYVFDCVYDDRCIDPTKLGINYIEGFHTYHNEMTDDKPILGITHWKEVVIPEPPK